MIEDEVKLALEPGVELPSLDDVRHGLRAEASPPVVLKSVYWDTADRRLLARSITLRRRTRGTSSTWDLKLPVTPGDVSVRRELSVSGRPAAPPPALADVVLGWTGGDELVPVATLRSRRLTWRVVDASGAEVAEVVDDEVEHLDGRRVLDRFREVEVERHGVREEYVARLVRRLEKAGARRSGETKLARMLGTTTVAPPSRVRRSAPVTDLLAASLRRASEGLLAADVMTRLGEDDGIHQMRVACRRMRSDLAMFAPYVDASWREALAADLKWLGSALGAARDAEVVADVVAAACDGLDAEGVLRDLAARRADAEAAVLTMLRDPRYLALVARLRGLEVVPGERTATAKDAATRAVDGAWRDLARSVRRLRGATGDEPWHDVRIDAKRARYTAETAATILGGDAARLAKAASAVQDVLGAFHDATMAIGVLMAMPEHGIVAGRLVERQRRAADEALTRFGGVWRRTAEPAWRRWRRR